MTFHSSIVIAIDSASRLISAINCDGVRSVAGMDKGIACADATPEQAVRRSGKSSSSGSEGTVLTSSCRTLVRVAHSWGGSDLTNTGVIRRFTCDPVIALCVETSMDIEYVIDKTRMMTHYGRCAVEIDLSK